MLQDDEITEKGRVNSLFFCAFDRLCFYVLLYFITARPHTFLLFVCVCICLWVCKCVSVFVPGHPKPSDFMDNKGERRVIDTRAANCC